MAANVALRKQDSFEQQAPAPGRDQVLARYRHLREISRRHNSGALDRVSADAMLQQARRLGLAQGKTLILDSLHQMDLVYDLLNHTAPAGRSRAIDRYARSAQFAAGSDEALVLAAMRDARFALLRVERRHPAAGLIVTDAVRNAELWLVDEGLEMSLTAGTLYATRYFVPDGFAMTAGVGMPVDADLVRDAFGLMPQHLRRQRLVQAIDDRRFAEALYRVALADGTMEQIRYLEPGDADDPV